MEGQVVNSAALCEMLSGVYSWKGEVPNGEEIKWRQQTQQVGGGTRCFALQYLEGGWNQWFVQSGGQPWSKKAAKADFCFNSPSGKGSSALPVEVDPGRVADPQRRRAQPWLASISRVSPGESCNQLTTQRDAAGKLLQEQRGGKCGWENRNEEAGAALTFLSRKVTDVETINAPLEPGMETETPMCRSVREPADDGRCGGCSTSQCRGREAPQRF